MEGAPDILLQGIVKRDGRSQPADGLIGYGRVIVRALDEDVLDDFDRRTKADSAGGFGKGAEQVQQDVEVSGQERVEVNEICLSEVRVVITGVLELCVLTQRLALAVEEIAESRVSGGRLAEETPIANLPDITGFEVDLDGKAGLQLEKLREFKDAFGSSSVNVCWAVPTIHTFPSPTAFKFLASPSRLRIKFGLEATY